MSNKPNTYFTEDNKIKPIFLSRAQTTNLPLSNKMKIKESYSSLIDSNEEYERTQKGLKLLDNFIRRNKNNFSDPEYIMLWSATPQEAKDNFVLWVEGWSDGCLEASHSNTKEEAFAKANLSQYWGREIKTVWFPPTSNSNRGISVSIFDFSTIHPIEREHRIDIMKIEKKRVNSMIKDLRRMRE